MVESDHAFELAAVAGTAEDAIDALGQVRVESSSSILKCRGRVASNRFRGSLRRGGAKIMIVSSMAEEGAEETVAALALGAADAMPKPGTGRFNGQFSRNSALQLEGARSSERRIKVPVMLQNEPGH